MDPLPCAPKDLQMPGTEFNPNLSTVGITGNNIVVNSTTGAATVPLHSAASVVSFQLDQLDGLGGQPDAKRLKKM